MIKAADLMAKFKYALGEKWGYIWGTSGQVWTQKDQNNASREMTVKYGSKWIGRRVADCSGLFRWAYRQLGTDCPHGSNSIYKACCTNRGRLSGGRRSDGQELKPGAAVFTGTEGDHGHIGLYIGGGDVIEAAGTQQGVIKSKVSSSKWTYWGELAAVDYSGGADPAPAEPEKPAEAMPTIRKGSKGGAVKLLQEALLRMGYPLPKYGADGDFGNETLTALKAFQQDNGLNADGVCGPKTWEKLEEAKQMQLYTVTIPHLPKHEAEALVKNYKESKMMEE